MQSRSVVLVEGVSDQWALEALAKRRGRDLRAEGVSIVPMGGSKNIGRFLERFGPRGANAGLAGLCDAGEEGDFLHALEGEGFGANFTRADMEQSGFFVCVADLEDELIRSLGAAAVERVIEVHGELNAFRIFQKQPAWRGRAREEQLRRFFGSQDRRNTRFPALLVAALDLTRVPLPLDGVLAHV